MTQTRKKPVVKIVHDCTQAEKINHLLDNNNKLSVIITGNGDPDHGLCRQVALLNERHGQVLKTLDRIDTSIDCINKKFEETFIVAKTAKDAIDKFKIEVKAEEKGIQKIKKTESEIRTDRRAETLKITAIITIVLMFLGICFSVYFSWHSSRSSERNHIVLQETKQQIQNSQPATTTRGGYFFDPLDGRTYTYDSVAIHKMDSIVQATRMIHEKDMKIGFKLKDK